MPNGLRPRDLLTPAFLTQGVRLGIEPAPILESRSVVPAAILLTRLVLPWLIVTRLILAPVIGPLVVLAVEVLTWLVLTGLVLAGLVLARPILTLVVEALRSIVPIVETIAPVVAIVAVLSIRSTVLAPVILTLILLTLILLARAVLTRAILPSLVGRRLIGGRLGLMAWIGVVVVVGMGRVAERCALVVAAILVAVIVVTVTGIAAGLLPILLLRAGDDAEIMLAVLEIVLRRDGIATGLRIARQLGVLIGDVLGSAANLDVGTIRFIGTRQRIGTLGAVAPAHPSVLIWSHRSRLTLVRTGTCGEAVRDPAACRRSRPWWPDGEGRVVRIVQSAVGICRACCLSRCTEARARVQALFGSRALIDQASARRLIARLLDRGRSPRNVTDWKAANTSGTIRLDGPMSDLPDNVTARRRANKHFLARR